MGCAAPLQRKSQVSPLIRLGEAGVNQDSRVDETNVICEQ